MVDGQLYESTTKNIFAVGTAACPPRAPGHTPLSDRRQPAGQLRARPVRPGLPRRRDRARTPCTWPTAPTGPPPGEPSAVEKYSLEGSVWTAEGSIAVPLAVGLAVSVSNGVASLYVTGGRAPAPAGGQRPQQHRPLRDHRLLGPRRHPVRHRPAWPPLRRAPTSRGWPSPRRPRRRPTCPSHRSPWRCRSSAGWRWRPSWWSPDDGTPAEPPPRPPGGRPDPHPDRRPTGASPPPVGHAVPIPPDPTPTPLPTPTPSPLPSRPRPQVPSNPPRSPLCTDRPAAPPSWSSPWR